MNTPIFSGSTQRLVDGLFLRANMQLRGCFSNPRGHLGELGEFDVVLLFGLLYHVENPMGLLRVVCSHAKDVCLVETQIAPNLSGVMDWGSYQYPKEIIGSIALVDEALEVQSGNREANTVALSMCPSVEALNFMMRAVGFGRIERLAAPDSMNEQLSSGKRIMIAGYKR